MGSENHLGSVKPGPEIKSQTLPWVLPVQGGAPGATGTISVVWAVPRSIELRGMGGSPEKRVRQPGPVSPGGLMDCFSGGIVAWGGGTTLFIGFSCKVSLKLQVLGLQED